MSNYAFERTAEAGHAGCVRNRHAQSASVPSTRRWLARQPLNAGDERTATRSAHRPELSFALTGYAQTTAGRRSRSAHLSFEWNGP